MTTNTLIALVDGSEYSESVCHHAAWIAGHNYWAVKIYHVLSRRDGLENRDLSGAIRLGARTRLLEQLSSLDEERAKLAKERGRAILEDAQAIVQGDGDIDVETRLRHDDLVETITAKESTGDMIVIGKRGEAAGSAKDHLGSNLERIVRASHRPVLIANRAYQEINSLLVAFDGGASSRKAVDYIAANSIFAGKKVTLVYAGEPVSDTLMHIDKAVTTLQTAGFDVNVVKREGDPETVLSDVAAQDGHELLVMGAYGHSRVRQLLIGSTTTAMIRSCKVPVLIVR